MIPWALSKLKRRDTKSKTVLVADVERTPSQDQMGFACMPVRCCIVLKLNFKMQNNC